MYKSAGRNKNHASTRRRKGAPGSAGFPKTGVFKRAKKRSTAPPDPIDRSVHLEEIRRSRGLATPPSVPPSLWREIQNAGGVAKWLALYDPELRGDLLYSKRSRRPKGRGGSPVVKRTETVPTSGVVEPEAPAEPLEPGHLVVSSIRPNLGAGRVVGSDRQHRYRVFFEQAGVLRCTRRTLRSISDPTGELTRALDRAWAEIEAYKERDRAQSKSAAAMRSRGDERAGRPLKKRRRTKRRKGPKKRLVAVQGGSPGLGKRR